jgi:drug/metabolite transporter (DMT)-like permease
VKELDDLLQMFLCLHLSMVRSLMFCWRKRRRWIMARSMMLMGGAFSGQLLLLFFTCLGCFNCFNWFFLLSFTPPSLTSLTSLTSFRLQGIL